MINNELSATAKTTRAVNPSNEEQLAEVPVSTQEDVDRAVAAAKAAFPSWSALSQDDRAAYLAKFADAIEANQEGFAPLLGKETGKPQQSAGMEFLFLIHQIRDTIKRHRLTEETIEDTDEVCLWEPLLSTSFAVVSQHPSLPHITFANLSLR